MTFKRDESKYVEVNLTGNVKFFVWKVQTIMELSILLVLVSTSLFADASLVFFDDFSKNSFNMFFRVCNDSTFAVLFPVDLKDF